MRNAISSIARSFGSKKQDKPALKAQTEFGTLLYHYEGVNPGATFFPAAEQISEKEILQKAAEILRQRAKGKVLKTPKAAKDLALHHCSAMEQCGSGLILLGADFQVLDLVDVTLGTTDACDLSPREVVKAALSANATGVFVYVNTLNQKPTFSEEDGEFANMLRAALALMDIRLLDILKTGTGGCLSMREESAKRAEQEAKKAEKVAKAS